MSDLFFLPSALTATFLRASNVLLTVNSCCTCGSFRNLCRLGQQQVTLKKKRTFTLKKENALPHFLTRFFFLQYPSFYNLTLASGLISETELLLPSLFSALPTEPRDESNRFSLSLYTYIFPDQVIRMDDLKSQCLASLIRIHTYYCSGSFGIFLGYMIYITVGGAQSDDSQGDEVDTKIFQFWMLDV